MFDGKLDIKSSDFILNKKGLKENGEIQKFIDSEIMRYMSDYMPRRQAGELIHSMNLSTTIGKGEINIKIPYAHYLHEGILYVSPTTGSAWAKKDEVKVPTSKELTYFGAPMRGKKFFDRMKADHKKDIIKAAQALINRGVR